MSVESAYDFPLSGFWSDRAVAEQVCDINGTRYLLRQLDEYMLFRREERNCVEHTFFASFRHSSVRNADPLARPGAWIRDGSRVAPLRQTFTPPIYSKQVFAEQIAKGEYGRVALCSCREARDCTPLLFFLRDGTGFFPDYDTANGYSAHAPKEVVHFAWDGTAQGIADIGDILTVEWPRLEPFCREIFTAQIWPRMQDPFIRYAETPDMPLAWKCGSQEELTRITHCILHTQPGEWLEIEAQVTNSRMIQNHCIPLFYQSQMENRSGGTMHSWSDRINALCKLAFHHNTFTGRKWEYNRYEGNTRRERYIANPLIVFCSIAPPSAHERAEALLTLWDWLKDKVSEEERRTYCGVEE